MRILILALLLAGCTSGTPSEPKESCQRVADEKRPDTISVCMKMEGM